MSYGCPLFFTFWCIALSGLSFCIVSVIGKLAREVEQLERKLSFHEDEIEQLRQHTILLYDKLDRKEEDAK